MRYRATSIFLPAAIVGPLARCGSDPARGSAAACGPGDCGDRRDAGAGHDPACDCDQKPNDCHFTSEVRYLFEYDAANVPTLSFREAANGEECDDKNRKTGDGCDANCKKEAVR